jgi:nitrite reductase/ring-hydroxylating ferredoxin subunit
MRAMSDRSDLSLAASYERLVPFSLGSIWEVLFDWPRLSHVHRDLFGTVRLVDCIKKGWCVETHSTSDDPRTRQVLRFYPDRTKSQFKLVTESGPGAGTVVLARLQRIPSRETAVSMQFYVTELNPQRRAQIGEKLIGNAKMMWERDEARMQHLADLGSNATHYVAPIIIEKTPKPLVLGSVDEVLKRIPFMVSFGNVLYRIYSENGSIKAHQALCPHKNGPLEPASEDPNTLACPWHGLRFKRSTGLCVNALGVSQLTEPPTIKTRNHKIVISGDAEAPPLKLVSSSVQRYVAFSRSKAAQPRSPMSTNGPLTL